MKTSRHNRMSYDDCPPKIIKEKIFIYILLIDSPPFGYLLVCFLWAASLLLFLFFYLPFWLDDGCGSLLIEDHAPLPDSTGVSARCIYVALRDGLCKTKQKNKTKCTRNLIYVCVCCMDRNRHPDLRDCNPCCALFVLFISLDLSFFRFCVSSRHPTRHRSQSWITLETCNNKKRLRKLFVRFLK